MTIFYKQIWGGEKKVRFTHRFCDFFGKIIFVVCKEENLLRLRYSIIHGKKILISSNCEFYKSSLYTETNENQNEKISDEF